MTDIIIYTCRDTTQANAPVAAAYFNRADAEAFCQQPGRTLRPEVVDLTRMANQAIANLDHVTLISLASHIELLAPYTGIAHLAKAEGHKQVAGPIGKRVWIDRVRRQIECFAVEVAEDATDETIFAAVHAAGILDGEPDGVHVTELTESVGSCLTPDDALYVHDAVIPNLVRETA